jgi:large subunit ribosomal protein L10
MAITKNKKNELVDQLKDNLSKSSFVVIAHYRGIDGTQLYNLRVNLKAKGCNMKIMKNTLVKIALKGTEMEILSDYLKGPTAILYSSDPVALAKTITETAKEIECLKIEAGYLDKSIVKLAQITNLASLGSLEEVRASFIGKLKGVQSNFVRVLQAPQSGLVALFNAKVKQG